MNNKSIWLDQPPFPDVSTVEEDRLDELDALSRDDEDFFYKTAVVVFHLLSDAPTSGYQNVSLLSLRFRKICAVSIL